MPTKVPCRMEKKGQLDGMVQYVRGTTTPDSKGTLAQRWPNNISYVGPTLAFHVGPM